MEIFAVLLWSLVLPFLGGAIGAGLGTFLGWQLHLRKVRRGELAKKKAEQLEWNYQKRRTKEKNICRRILNALRKENKIRQTCFRIRGWERLAAVANYTIRIESPQDKPLWATRVITIDCSLPDNEHIQIVSGDTYLDNYSSNDAAVDQVIENMKNSMFC